MAKKLWLVTAVRMTRDSRRRAGKSWSEKVEVDALYTARDVESWFEQNYNLKGVEPGQEDPGTCKVIDVREIRETASGRFIEVETPVVQRVARSMGRR